MAAESIRSIKQVAETPNLSTIPCQYIHDSSATASEAAADDSIPTVDLWLLNSENGGDRAEAIQDLDKACREWGFFMIRNHGIAEEVMRGMVEVATEFFNLPEEEKPEFESKDVLTPIRYGTSFNTAAEDTFFWRDFLKLFVHPHFHSPAKPPSLRGLLEEYSERIRGVTNTLFKAMSESLGVEMEAALNLKSSLQIMAANYYPRCPNPDMTLGLPPHSDHGLLTVLIDNHVGGLQILHDDTWLNVSTTPNTLLVNVADQLEIFSNGRYKSVLHKAVVNREKTRVSIAVANGPSLDTVVRPAPGHVQGGVAAYVPMKYEDYVFRQQSNSINGKSNLERVKLQH